MIEIGIIKDTPVNKIIDIRDKNQVIKAKYTIGKDDKLKYSLMSEHYIEISFELNRNVLFKRSDYIEWEGDKYILREDYQPEQINKWKYKYILKFEALEMFFQDIQYWYQGEGLNESEWRMSGKPEYFLKYVIENANRYFKTKGFNIGTVEPTELKDISFNINTNTYDALTQIAEEYNAEWYLIGKTLHLLNKVSFGEEVDFETEVSVLSMDRQEGESTAKYTRLLAFGSTRNIPYNYRETTANEVVDAIYTKRLRIPASKGGVIDAYSNISPEEVVEGTVVFNEVYPKRVGTIEAIGTIEYTDTNEETGEKTKWNAYKLKDSGINFKKDYILPGQELKLQFTSGDLNGRDFVLEFHQKGFSKTDDSQYFEIIRTDEYGKQLPNDILKPKEGDKYVLYGFDIALVSDQYVPAAEQELYDVAVKWQQKQFRDTGVYECPTVIGYFRDRQMDLAIGQKVKLVFDDEAKSTRSSRIMGFEKKLYNKYDAIYTVGDNATYSRLAAIEKEIKQLQVAGVMVEGTKAGNGVYIIKQFESTTPTDFNVYSAKATDAKYLNKQTGGTVQGNTRFDKNVQVQGLAISDVFQNSTFTAGQFGSGFQLKRDTNGQSYMEIDNLLVRREALFNKLTIAEIKSVGGTILLSLANMVVSKVENKTKSFKCYFNNEDGTIPNDFAVGDQAICRKFTGKNIKYYWALVTAVGSDYIELSKTDKDGSGVPDIDDEVVQLGNRTDVNRQYAIMLSAYGSAAPSINQYAGINSYDLTGKEVTTISPKGNRFTGSFTISTNGTTAPIYKDLGLFVNGKTYYLNDRVSHLGSYWVCIVNSTVQTPNEDSSVWRKDTTGQTDINNAINQIQIGSRNYVLGSKELKHGGGSNNYTFLPLNLSEGLQSNTEYTLSVGKSEILSGSNTSNYTVLLFNISTNASSSIFTLPVSNSKQSYSFKTGVLPNNGYTLLFYTGISGSSANRSMRWTEVKLEKANKASDWSPAPEDIESSIQSVRTEYISDFKVLNDQISSKVSQSDFNVLGNRVSTTESNINQLSDSITSTVEKVDNISTNSRNFTRNFRSWSNDRVITSFIDDDHITMRLTGNQDGAKGSNIINRGGDCIYAVNIKTAQATAVYIGLRATTLISTSHPGLFDKYDGTTAFFNLPAGFNERIIMYVNHGSTVNANWYIGIKYGGGGREIELSYPQLIKANKYNDWTPAPEDTQAGIDNAQSSANNAQNTADSKNRSYSQDAVPTVPSGGHKVGDLWYKTSLVDSSGNINADISKNIFQLQYRWDGSVWRQINWSVSKSKIEQTDSSISMIVEKTGINSVGAGSSLFSMIKQTENKITLEVGKVQTNSRNFTRNFRSWSNDQVITSFIDDDHITMRLTGNQDGAKGSNIINRGGDCIYAVNIKTAQATAVYIGLRATTLISTSHPGLFDKYDGTTAFFNLPAGFNERIIMYVNHGSTVNANWYIGIKYGGGGREIELSYPQLIKANKYNDWTPAPEDTQAGIDSKTTLEEVSSSLTLTDNKISLASKTIELKGTTIAKAIEAEDLKVGTGASALEVLKDGTFYAKGSNGVNSSLIIDSRTQSINIQSPISTSGAGGNINGSSKVTISSESGGIRIDGPTEFSSNSVAIVSNSGIFANTAGQGIYPPSLGIKARASIVGLGWGNIPKDDFTDNNFVAGVYGSASNSGSASSFGGYFEVLKANGLCLSVRSITGNTQLINTDCYVNCYNTISITVNLPINPNIGQVIFLRQIQSAGFIIRGKNGVNGYRIHTDGSLSDAVNNRAGRGDTSVLVFDGTYWMFNYWAR